MNILPRLVKNKRGLRIGRLLVTDFVEMRDRRSYWKCLCDCGNTSVVAGGNLRKGKTQSCGCLNVEKMRQTGLLRPSGTTAPAGQDKDRLQKIYRGMIDRCTSQRCSAWKMYGGRGISVCSEWIESFDAFYYWAVSNGYDCSLTIDRVENNSGYSPSNCRWATRKEQSNNRRTSSIHSAFGETKTLAMWIEDSKCFVTVPTIKSRLNQGWAFQKAISTPAMPREDRARLAVKARLGKARLSP